MDLGLGFFLLWGGGVWGRGDVVVTFALRWRGCGVLGVAVCLVKDQLAVRLLGCWWVFLFGVWGDGAGYLFHVFSMFLFGLLVCLWASDVEREVVHG